MSDSGIFKAALKLPPEGRAAYLDQACGSDVELRQEVESLLRAHDAAGSFLQERPAVTHEQTGVAERPGTVIGPYKLMEQIGEGGMGLVFVAEQQQPVRRKVALKIIKPGMDSRQVIARFEAERQALAMMDHLNIAKVHDAGTTSTGRPYFVMELVHGIAITDYCDANQLTPRERLELFMPVCHAIQHAHQKGIIHRDIKPSNVLVTLYDDKPVPKIIDFGVAKAIEQRLTEKTLYTQFGTLVGTFEYMSPEQAEMNAFGVDTRSDVYSLGVLLYELLTGSTPLERLRLREAAFGEVVRLIKEEEPPRPSLRLSTSNTLAKVAAARKTEPGKLSRLVRGELDWIVMRCLEKDRTRRYETASGLARDVERHLKDEPVEARPPSTLYRVRKAARRHKVAVTSALLIAGALLLGIVVSMRQALRAREAEEQARHALEVTEHARAAEMQQRDIAQQHLHKAEEARQAALTERARAEQAREQEAMQRLRAQDNAVRATRHLYVAHMNLAQRAWEDADLQRLRELLEQQRPEQSGVPDRRGFEWHYLWRLGHASLLTLDGHAGGSLNFNGVVAYSPDGRRLASGAPDKTIKIWDAATGQELHTLKGHNDVVRCVAFSSDGKRLASGGGSGLENKPGVVKVWDTDTGREILSLTGHGAAVMSVAFSPDDKRLASGSGNVFFETGEVKLWDAVTGKETLTLKNNKHGVSGIAFSPDGTRLAAASMDKAVRVWNTTTGEEAYTLKGHQFWVASVAFGPDGARLASSGGLLGKPGDVKIWDTATGKEILGFAAHAGPVASVAFSPDGKRLATASWDRTVKVWDASRGQELLTLKGHANWVNSVVFSPDGTRLASGSNDRTVKVWDAGKPQGPLTLARRHDGQVASVAFSPDGAWLAYGSGNNDVGTIEIWDVSAPKEVRSLKGHASMVAGVAFSPDGKRLASASWDKTVKLWNAATGQEVRTHVVKDQVYSVAFSPDGKRLACGANYGRIIVWDAVSGQENFALKGHTKGVHGLAFSPDGKRLASGGDDGAVKIWDMATGQELLALKGDKNLVRHVAFSPDGSRLVSSGATVKVWDALTGQETLTLQGAYGRVAFSPDGQRLASASGDRVTIWDTVTGLEILALRGHAREINSLAFSPDGRRLASGSGDATVKVWDATPVAGTALHPK